MTEGRSSAEIVRDYSQWAEFFLVLRRYARSGSDLIGLGEVVQFFDRVVDDYADLDEGEGIEIDALVTISAVLRQEGASHIVYAELTASDSFELGEIVRDGHSFSRRMYSWDPCFNIRYSDCFDWRDLFEEVLSQGRLEVSRDHV